MSYQQAMIETNANIIIDNACKAMKANLLKVLKSGAIDIQAYDTVNNTMILPKAIVSALLEEEIDQIEPPYKNKEFDSNKKNVKHFI